MMIVQLTKQSNRLAKEIPFDNGDTLRFKCSLFSVATRTNKREDKNNETQFSML